MINSQFLIYGLTRDGHGRHGGGGGGEHSAGGGRRYWPVDWR